MFNKTFLIIAISSVLLVAGCGDNEGESNKGSQNEYKGGLADQVDNLFNGTNVYPVFNPALSQLPLPNDLIFDGTASDGTFRDASEGETNPVVIALGGLSGASTIAPVDLPLSGEINGATLDARDFIVAGGSVIPNPTQNVFVIEVDYASGEPVQALSAQETPTIPIALTAQAAQLGDPNAGARLLREAQNPAMNASVVNLGGQWTLRISPTRPLKPKTRYVVVVTNEIKDILGNPIIQSPSYFALQDATIPTGSTSLDPVRALILNFWEQIAGTYFSKLTNAARQAPLELLSADNIALAYSFTTSGDEKVLEYIANPTEWFDDQLTAFVRLQATAQVKANSLDLNGDEAVDYFDNEIAADGAIASFPDEATATALAALFASPPPNGCQGVTGAAAITCVSTVLATAPSNLGGFADLLPTPRVRNVAVTSSNVPLALMSAPASAVLTSTTITPLVAQGTIDIPYYLGIPTASDGSAIQSSFWQADSNLAAAMNTAFASVGLEIPQGAGKSSFVNYVFPFPAQSDGDSEAAGTNDLTIPWLAIYPDANCPTPYPTVIYQHGITADRSAALSVGGVLAERCYATVAIDQVIHGVAPVSTEDKLSLADTLLAVGQDNGLPPEVAPGDANNQAAVNGVLTIGFVSAAAQVDAATAQGIIDSVLAGGSSGSADLDAAILGLKSIEASVANAGSTIPGLAPTTNERHFNFTADATLSPVPMNFDESAAFGSSGSLYFNLLGFLNSRDKNRQGVVDLLNLRQTIATMDLTGDGTPDLDANNVVFMGHSLGTYTGTTFVAVANSTPVGSIDSAVLLTPASGVVRMLENSPAFAPTVVGGLAAAGIAQGTSSYEAFMNFFQAALDSVDPINFADNLNTAVNFADYGFSDTNYHSASNSRFQTSAQDTGVLMIELAGRPDVNGNPQLGFASDSVNPIETLTTQLTTSFGTALPTFLSGTEKLAQQMGAENIESSPAVDLNSPDTILSRLSFGSHTMYVLPVLRSGEEALFGDAATAETTRRQTAFIEGMTQAIAFFGGQGELADGDQLNGAIPDAVDVGLDSVAAAAGVSRELICASIGIGSNPDANPCSSLESAVQFEARLNQQLNP